MITKTVQLTIGDTIIERKYDDLPGSEDIVGEWGNKLKPGCIIRFDKSFYEDHVSNEDYEAPEYGRNVFPIYYPPDNGEVPGTENYRKYALQDYKRMIGLVNNEWSFIGIIITTKYTSDVLELSGECSDALWGVESDGGKEYIGEIIGDLKSNVKDQLLKLGFPEAEIEESFKNATTKGDY